MERTEFRPARQGKLGHEIAAVLVFKLLALLLIWALFFSSPPVPNPDPHTTAAHLMGGGASIHVLPGVQHD